MNIDSDPKLLSPELKAAIDAGKRLLELLTQPLSHEEIAQYLESKSQDEIALWVQEDETGWSVLHFAVHRRDPELTRALIEAGAVWNLVDACGNTAGDVALSLNDEECYRLIRDAGIRSEFLLHLLDTRAQDEDEEMEEPSTISSIQDIGADSYSDTKGIKRRKGNTLVLRAEDSTPAGSTEAFLNAKLTFATNKQGQDLCLVDSGSEQVGVMMGWERPIMEETVRLLHKDNDDTDFRVLNCGFGLGIIDTYFQKWPTPPSLHVIIEPHPDVLAHMRARGWYDMANVRILEGKWQDFIDSDEILGVGGFDAVYTDVFSEDYKQLYAFFERVPELLRGENSKFSFFHGLGATNPLFYDIYTNLCEMHLKELGCTVSWTDVDVHTAQADGIWGETRKYFSLPYCRIPLVKMDI